MGNFVSISNNDFVIDSFLLYGLFPPLRDYIVEFIQAFTILNSLSYLKIKKNYLVAVHIQIR